jgi:hypothetical protein
MPEGDGHGDGGGVVVVDLERDGDRDPEGGPRSQRGEQRISASARAAGARALVERGDQRARRRARRRALRGRRGALRHEDVARSRDRGEEGGVRPSREGRDRGSGGRRGRRATFTKKTTSKDGKTIEVLGYLEARQVQGAWKIVVEGDTTTDRNLERARERRCTSAVLAIVHATDEAKRAMASIEQGAKKQPASDPVNVAGRVMPPQAGSSEWYVGICEDHADRMLCLNHFEVSKDTGVVRYMGIEGSDPDWHAIKTDPRLMADVVSSCK